MSSLDRRHVTVAEAQAALDASSLPFVPLLRHGTLLVEAYAPEEVDLQTPHEQDELYVVVRGEGWFVNGDQRHRFGPGDVLFVPAGVVHRFEEFTEDFLVWVVFYGPPGGEAAGP